MCVLAALSFVLISCGDGASSTATPPATATDSSSTTTAGAATDADAMKTLKDAQIAIETYATDNGGTYSNADPATLAKIEPTLADSNYTVTADASGYTIKASSSTGNEFSVVKDASGSVTYPCTTAGSGDCPSSGTWG